MAEITVNVSKKIGAIFSPVHHPISGKIIRYRGAYGGRGSGKSTDFAQMAVVRKIERPGNFLCCRELQKSIKDSVYSLIREQISVMGANECFEVGETFIRSKIHPDTQFLFNGLRTNPQEIKSMNRLDGAWVEESQSVSQKSLDLLLPTVRMDGSEVWFTWNPMDELDPVHDMLVTKQPDNAIVSKVNFYDNPFFPNVLEEERQRVLKFQPQRYDWIWEGNFNTNTDGAVYGKWIADMEKLGRLKEGIYDPSMPVYTAWDLGFSDDTAIWWWQSAGNEIRLIDYYENNREGIKHYCEQLIGHEIIVDEYGDNGKVIRWHKGDEIPSAAHRKTWNYGKHFVPHDAANKLLQAGGRSTVQQAHEFGVMMHVVGATSQQNQIEALRRTLEYTWADPVRCRDGIRALRKYQFLYDDDRNKYLDKPDHDGYSHGADAAEIIAQVWKSAIITEEKKKPRFLEDLTANELFYPTSPQGTGYNRI